MLEVAIVDAMIRFVTVCVKYYYYMAFVCGRYNARSDWLIVTEL